MTPFGFSFLLLFSLALPSFGLVCNQREYASFASSPAAKARAEQFAKDIWDANTRSRSRVVDRGRKFEAEAMARSKAGEPVVVDFLGVGAGPQSATFFSSLRQVNPKAKTVVLEATNEMGTFDRLAGAFALNSPELPESTTNPVHGSPIQVPDLNLRANRDISSELLGGATIEAWDYAETPILFGRRSPAIEKQPPGEKWPAPYRIVSPDGLVIYAKNVVIGTGPGKNRTSAGGEAADSVAELTEKSRAAELDPATRPPGPPLVQTGDAFLQEGKEAIAAGRDPYQRYRGKEMLFVGGSHGAYSSLIHAIGESPMGAGKGDSGMTIDWIGRGEVRDSRDIYTPAQEAVNRGRVSAIRGRLLGVRELPNGKVEASFSAEPPQSQSMNMELDQETAAKVMATKKVPGVDGRVVRAYPLKPLPGGKVSLRVTVERPIGIRTKIYDGIVTNFGYEPGFPILENFAAKDGGPAFAPVRGELADGLNGGTGLQTVTLGHQVVDSRGNPENVFVLAAKSLFKGRGDFGQNEHYFNPGTLLNLYGRRTASLALALGARDAPPPQVMKFSEHEALSAISSLNVVEIPPLNQPPTPPPTLAEGILTAKKEMAHVLEGIQFRDAGRVVLSFDLSERKFTVAAEGGRLEAADLARLGSFIRTNSSLLASLEKMAKEKPGHKAEFHLDAGPSGRIKMEKMDLVFEKK